MHGVKDYFDIFFSQDLLKVLNNEMTLEIMDKNSNIKALDLVDVEYDDTFSSSSTHVLYKFISKYNDDNIDISISKIEHNTNYLSKYYIYENNRDEIAYRFTFK